MNLNPIERVLFNKILNRYKVQISQARAYQILDNKRIVFQTFAYCCNELNHGNIAIDQILVDIAKYMENKQEPIYVRTIDVNHKKDMTTYTVRLGAL